MGYFYYVVELVILLTLDLHFRLRSKNKLFVINVLVLQ